PSPRRRERRRDLRFLRRGGIMTDVLRIDLLARPSADTTELASYSSAAGNPCIDGELALTGRGSTAWVLWVFSAVSTSGASSTVVVPVNAPTAGRWLR